MFIDDTYEGWTADLARLVRAPDAVPAEVRERLRWIWPRGWSVPAVLAALACLPERPGPAAEGALAIALDLLDRALHEADKASRGAADDSPFVSTTVAMGAEAVAEALDRARRKAGGRHRGDLDYGPLVRLAQWLPDGSPLWPICMDKIVRVAMVVGEAAPGRAREAIARWVDLFLKPAPARTRADYRAAAFLLTRFRVTDADVLFPRLLAALDDPRQRAWVLEIADENFPKEPGADPSVTRRTTIPAHPMVGRLDYLARLITGAAEPGATPDAVDDAVAACRTLYWLPGAAAAALLADTLAHPAPAVRVDTAAALARWDDPRARRVFAEAWNDPRTHRAASEYVPEHWEYEEDFLRAGLYSPRKRAEDWLGQEEFDRRVAELGSRLDGWLAGRSELPPGVEVIARHDIEWPGDPTPDFMCVVRHSFPAGPDGQTIKLTVAGTTRGWRASTRADSAASVRESEVVSQMYLRHLWAVDKHPERRSPYERLFAGWPGGLPADLRVRAVAELDPALGGGVAAAANARRGGEPGWAVIHGRRTHWYPLSAEDAPFDGVGALGRYVACDVLGLADHATV